MKTGKIQGIKETDFNFPHQSGKYSGKVRDVYFFDDKILMVATDRISAFDVILPREIPYKGQVLNQLASKNLINTKDIVANWFIDMPDPNASFGYNCEALPVEFVVRGYLVGHANRIYKSGGREICGVKLPDGLIENQKFESPIITPTTKAKEGHDEDISKEEIIRRGFISKEIYEKIENIALKLFERGTKIAKEKGLILVDTKYEFGLLNDDIFLIDEVHTPDSSRYFYLENYQENLDKNLPQKQLSKEFVREWLIENNFQGKPGQKIPEMTDEKVSEISERYIELYEKLSGEKFDPAPSEDPLKRVQINVSNYLNGVFKE